jgi:hypothetical protein
MTMASEADAASLDGRRGSNASVSLNNASQCDDDTPDPEVVGYQETDIHCHHYPADDETLRLISSNDTGIAGLYLGLPDNDWVDRSEQICEAIIKKRTFAQVGHSQ